LFGYGQKKAWEFSDKFMSATESEVVQAGAHAIIGKKSSLRNLIQKRMDFFVLKIGPSKTYENLWGNKVVMTFNPSVGTYEVREDFYESKEAWYIVSMDDQFISNGGSVGGFRMINKSYVDSYMNAHRLNPDLANNVLNVLWLGVSDISEAVQTNAHVYMNG